MAQGAKLYRPDYDETAALVSKPRKRRISYDRLRTLGMQAGSTGWAAEGEAGNYGGRTGITARTPIFAASTIHETFRCIYVPFHNCHLCFLLRAVCQCRHSAEQLCSARNDGTGMCSGIGSIFEGTGY